MGTKRPTKTTKSGRFMNPTDQARKEARKKELKKNKKQRQHVRQAVLKGKNFNGLINELEQIEQMELETIDEGLPTSKSLREKKLKVRETLKRIEQCYEKEKDKEQVGKIQRAMQDYEGRRKKYLAFFHHRKELQLQDSTIDLQSIPLPDMAPKASEKPASTSGCHESVSSLLSLPANLTPPAPPSNKPPKCSISIGDIKRYGSSNKMESFDSLPVKHDSEESRGGGPGMPGIQTTFSGVPMPPSVQVPRGVMLYNPGENVRHQLRPMFHQQTAGAGNPYLAAGAGGAAGAAGAGGAADKYASAIISKKATTVPTTAKVVMAAPTAAPQNRQDRVTKFVPVSVKMRKRMPETSKPAKTAPSQESGSSSASSSTSTAGTTSQQQRQQQQQQQQQQQRAEEKVDAYQAFMSEMEGLM